MEYIDAVRRVLNSSLMIMMEDHDKIEDRKDKSKSSYGAIVGRENTIHARGSIIAFLELNPQRDEVDMFTHNTSLIHIEGQLIKIADDHFPRFFSENLDTYRDRGRVVVHIREGTRNAYYFCIDGIFRNFGALANKRVEKLFNNGEGIEDKLYLNPADSLEQVYVKANLSHRRRLDMDFVYRSLLADAYGEDIGTRTNTGLELALAIQEIRDEMLEEGGYTIAPPPARVIISRVTVPEQSRFDKTETYHNPLRHEDQLVTRSRLGTGDVLEFGPEGLLSRTLLRIDLNSDAVEAIGEVRPDLERGETTPLPVFMQKTKYAFDKEKLSVVPIDSPNNPRNVLKSETPYRDLEERKK